MNPLAKVVVRAARKGSVKVQKHLPEILLATGIIGTVASTVLACRATVKAQPIIDDAKNELDKIHNDLDNGSENKKNQELVKFYIKTGTNLAKVYALPVTVGFASVSCLVGSNVIARRELSAAVAAYTALSESFRKYRDRIEGDISNDIPIDESHMIQIADPIPSYRFIFDKNNPNWKDNVDYNLSFIRGCQTYLDILLKRDGFLFVNDFCNELGFPKTSSGQLDGWIIDDKNPDSYQDGYVSFGLLNRDKSKSEALKAYENGDVDYLVLTLNIDGPIVDRI